MLNCSNLLITGTYEYLFADGVEFVYDLIFALELLFLSTFLWSWWIAGVGTVINCSKSSPLLLNNNLKLELIIFIYFSKLFNNFLPFFMNR